MTGYIGAIGTYEMLYRGHTYGILHMNGESRAGAGLSTVLASLLITAAPFPIQNEFIAHTTLQTL